MANRGWSSDGGDARASNSTATGDVTGVDGAEAFVRGARDADPGMHNDLLDQRSDLFAPPGNMSTC